MKRLGTFAAWASGGTWKAFLHRLGVVVTAASGVLEFAHILAPQWGIATAALGLITRLDQARRVLPLFPPEGVTGQAIGKDAIEALKTPTPVTKPEPKP